MSLTGLAVALLGLISLAAIAAPAAAADLPFHASPRLAVSGTEPIAVTGLMPGDALARQTITIAATGAVRYSLRAITTGSPALTRLLTVSIIEQRSGTVLYAGPLVDAAIGTIPGSDARTLTDGSEVLTVEAALPSSAGNEVQGASLSIGWVVQATELAGP
jgi:hypothetical protein